jgi:hypothetical protein
MNLEAHELSRDIGSDRRKGLHICEPTCGHFVVLWLCVLEVKMSWFGEMLMQISF